MEGIRECGEYKKKKRGKHWGVLRARWNGVAIARGHNAQDRGIRNGWTEGGRVQKASVRGGGIRLTSLKIQKGRARGLETAIRTLQKLNMDVGFLQETKLTQGIHTQHGAGYDVSATEVEIRHQGE